MENGFRIAQERTESLQKEMENGFRIAQERTESLQQKMADGFKIVQERSDGQFRLLQWMLGVTVATVLGILGSIVAIILRGHL